MGGFQTARQLNNKLQGPRRLKKDPLTQTSINTFFANGAAMDGVRIKEEPQDDNNPSSNSSDKRPAADSIDSSSSKRAKIDKTPVKIKIEPVETHPDEPGSGDDTDDESNHQIPVVKKEHPDDPDSGDNTDDESNHQLPVVKQENPDDPGSGNETADENDFVLQTEKGQDSDADTQHGSDAETDETHPPIKRERIETEEFDRGNVDVAGDVPGK